VGIALLVLLGAGPRSAAQPAPPTPAVPNEAGVALFEKEIRPVLVSRCIVCHGPQQAQAGLRLDSRSSMLRGGRRGPAVIPGRPAESRLVAVVEQRGDLRMPPSGKLSDREIRSLTEWVRQGASWPVSPPASVGARAPAKALWSLQPVRLPPVPGVKDPTWPASPVDRFILSALEARGLRPAPEADRRTLIRRVTFDLTGLPPTPEEVAAFLADPTPDAYPRLVDRLLASPHYGERWGRHWLDVVRYADSTANDANAVMRFAYRYRDYVVDAFNRDLPYPRFVEEQLAGDLLPAPEGETAAERFRRVSATGFLMVGPKALAETDKEQSRLDIVDDQVDVTARALLGLTVGCARCHDHKFDPIPTADYYALAGIFRSTEPFQDEVRNASMWWEFPLEPAAGEKPVLVMAPKEGKVADLRIHLRGNRHTLGEAVSRGFPRAVPGARPASLPAGHSGRLELARWIVSPENPLTRRVLVNRIWQHHFGAGLVTTSDNFGHRGTAPSHPELLDWLAVRFGESGGSIKAMHRLLLNSGTYRQAYVPNPRAQTVDPSNRLLWRMPRRRLEAEELRDAVLAVSGRLDRTRGGAPEMDLVLKTAQAIDAKRGFYVANTRADDECYRGERRALYLPVMRNAPPEVLALFDAADPNNITAVRNDTTVAPQAMFMLNHPFVREQALHFARSLLNAPASGDPERIRRAYLRAVNRPPSPLELAEALAYLGRYAERAGPLSGRAEGASFAAWQSFCQMLFCSNEFVYLN
jgi:cytochrome c553